MINIVKYIQIHKAITTKLRSKFPNVKITSEDVTEGILRPSFFISFDSVKASDFMNQALDRNLTIRIYYFSKDSAKNKIELLNIQDDLNDLFLTDNLVEIDTDTSIEIHEIDFNVIDKVLHCYFDIMLCENYNRNDNTPNMENLDFGI